MKYKYRGGVLYSNSYPPAIARSAGGYSIFYWAGTRYPDYMTWWTVVRWALIESVDGLEFV